MKLKDKFIQTMREIAILNGKEESFNEWYKKEGDNLYKLLSKKNEDDNEEVKSYTLREIFGFNSQRKNLIRSFICWFLLGCNFYGIILNLGYSKHNFYITCFCSFCGEITGEISSGFLAGIFGRVRTIYSLSFLGGISLLVYTVLDSELINFICIYLATLGIAGAFNINFIYTPELYPTPIRGTVCSYTFLLSRVGAMVVSPITSIFGPNKTNILFSCSAIAAGIIISNMPETLGRELENEIPEFEETNSLIDIAKDKLKSSKRYLISEKLFKTSFIGHDPLSLRLIGSGNFSKYSNFGSGIYSMK
jgi:hypothetical protein